MHDVMLFVSVPHDRALTGYRLRGVGGSRIARLRIRCRTVKRAADYRRRINGYRTGAHPGDDLRTTAADREQYAHRRAGWEHGTRATSNTRRIRGSRTAVARDRTTARIDVSFLAKLEIQVQSQVASLWMDPLRHLHRLPSPQLASGAHSIGPDLT